MNNPLEAYTEKAFSLLGRNLPEVVYLPPSLRTRPTAQDPSTEQDDQLDRIVKADPLGFLFAILEGKSLVSFTVKPSEQLAPTAKRRRGRPKKETATDRMKLRNANGHDFFAEFHSPGIADRERVAMFLAKLIANSKREDGSRTPDDDEFSVLCARRAAESGHSSRVLDSDQSGPAVT